MGKLKCTAIVLITFLTLSANAERWILKNPKQTSNLETMRNLKAHSFLNLKNKYLILDFEGRVSPKDLVESFNAETAFRDIKIVIDKPEEGRAEVAPMAWHVDFLKYPELNNQFTGQGVIVAVIDTGVDYTHKALVNKMWKNKKEIPNNKIDDDNNGLVDDYHGYNFTDNEADPKDVGGHGTHCAGIIAADVDPISKAQGVAQHARIMPLLIINGNYSGFLSAAAQAVKYATDNGAKVLSNSWRIYNDWEEFINEEGIKMLDEAISYAGDNGVIFAAAAGNEKKNLDKTNLENPIIPLSLKYHRNMIGIAASAYVDNEEALSVFSNYGEKLIAIAAPGTNIYSTYPNNSWKSMSGTSMATPLIAGTLARGFSKGYSMKQALNELKQTSNKTTYWQQYITHGRVDIKKYLE